MFLTNTPFSIKELQDAPGNEYFSNLKKKALSGADNAAKVDVAEANYKGNVGQKQKEALTRQEVAKYESETLCIENENRKTTLESDTNLNTLKVELDQKIGFAKILKDRAIEKRDLELSKEVEIIRSEQNLERLRANQLVQTQVEMEGLLKTSEANAQKAKLDADAHLYAEQQKAKAIEAKYNAEAEGLKQMLTVFEKPEHVLSYMMLNKGVYTELARENAKAIQDMKPKISIWTNGSGSEGASDPMSGIRNIFQALPPLLTTIQDQTGVNPPSWLAKMSSDTQTQTVQKK